MCILFSLIFVFLNFFQTEVQARRNLDESELYVSINQAEFDDELNLSPWELHALNDLLVEITLLKCSKVDINKARSMKEYISKSVGLATRKSSMNPKFWGVYNNYISCIEFLEGKRGLKQLNPVNIEVNEDNEYAENEAAENSAEKNIKSFEVSPAPLVLDYDDESYTDQEIFSDNNDSTFGSPESAEPSKTELLKEFTVSKSAVIEKPESSATKISKEKVSKTLKFKTSKIENFKTSVAHQPRDNSIVESAVIMVSNLFNNTVNLFSFLSRKKRDLQDHLQTNNIRHSGSRDTKRNSLQLNKIIKKQVRVNFKKMIQIMFKTARHSCPIELTPRHQFTKQVTKEIVHWILIDPDSAVEAYNKYFIETGLFDQMKHCVNKHSTPWQTRPVKMSHADRYLNV